MHPVIRFLEVIGRTGHGAFNGAVAIAAAGVRPGAASHDRKNGQQIKKSFHGQYRFFLFPPPGIILGVFCFDGSRLLFAEDLVKIDKELITKLLLETLYRHAQILAVPDDRCPFVVDKKSDGTITVRSDSGVPAVTENGLEEGRGHGHFLVGAVEDIVPGPLCDATGDDIAGIGSVCPGAYPSVQIIPDTSI